MLKQGVAERNSNDVFGTGKNIPSSLGSKDMLLSFKLHRGGNQIRVCSPPFRQVRQTDSSQDNILAPQQEAITLTDSQPMHIIMNLILP